MPPPASHPSRSGRLALPIDDVLDDLEDAGPTVIVEAPPGAGKTTRVPPRLLDLVDGRIVVLEPRRVAARAAAARMADEAGDRVGGLVGVTTRDDRRTSRDTRIEVVTEGVLVNRLQRDPGLRGVGAVVLDEFHERSLDADLALAFTREVQALRDDLWVVVMSATLDQERLRTALPDATAVSAPGRRFDVGITHRPRAVTTDLEVAVAETVDLALHETDGNVLVFVPGMREIRRSIRAIRAGDRVDVVGLHGSMGRRAQDDALRPTGPGRRRVIVATDVAESSLTVPDVTAVVDSGLVRQPQLHPATGLTRLVTVPTSRASEDQRTGRAGRVRPGHCWRLYSATAPRDPHPTPEIATTDLTGMALQVANWGASVDELLLLDRPSPDTWSSALRSLRDLGAVDDRGDGTATITAHGRRLVRMPTDPRLAHVLVEADRHGRLDDVARAVAVLSEGDPSDARHADLAARLELLARGEGRHRRWTREATRLARATRRGRPDGWHPAAEDASVGALLATGFPRRIGHARRRGQFTLASGRGAFVPDHDPLATAEFVVALDVDDRGTDGRIRLGAPVTRQELEAVLGDRLERTTTATWDTDRRDVVATATTGFGAVVLGRVPAEVPIAARQAALLDGVRQQGLDLLGWDRPLRQLCRRAAHVATAGGVDLPAMDDRALLADLDDWLAPFLASARTRADLARVPLRAALEHRLGRDGLAVLDREAPTHVRVPSGRSVAVDYDDERGPAIRVKLQEMFGTTRVPRVAGEPVVVIMESPAGRPLQITRDLTTFWADGYPGVRADMRGRYPKHPWPENPLTATPTRRTKR
ncbi:ATP-dependent helicase HrpB [Salsipaludibacter albus]|uniref:ATP-dependent helicase HrpB n=1 Tax=Salsipaludibacter albus TaxID=2849650 RepID=UPI001EE403AC|nr:ATP-dependent helicase HrpB [Salsipaludibacter albus]MBY5162819.1 ATP-dependent helicase HrpB [Salsipaludibacter albus]